MRTETDSGKAWMLRSSGEFLWAYKPGGEWVPAGTDGTFGLNDAALAGMRTGAHRALAFAEPLKTDTLKRKLLRRALRAKQYACTFRMVPPASVPLEDFTAEVAETLSWDPDRISNDTRDNEPVALHATVLVVAGWQQGALEYANKNLGARLDGLRMTAMHCLVVAR